MKPAVERAIAEIREEYFETELVVREDGEGGAYVIIEEVDVGPLFKPSKTWVGFRINFQYPHADTYPHYVRGDLARADGSPLGSGTSPNNTFEGRPAIQISRRSNHLNPQTETALIKLKKVLIWLASSK